MSVDNDITNRIVILRKDLGLNKSEFARGSHITTATINEVEAGKKGAGAQTLISIASSFGVSLNWLALGLGPMYIKDIAPVEACDQLLSLADLPPQGEAEGLKEILKNPDLVRKIGLTKDDVDWLNTWLRRSPTDLKNMPPEWFLMSLASHRKAQLDAISQAIKDYMDDNSKS